MQFHKVEPNEVLSELRYLSENAVWHLGIYPTIFGWRVALYREGHQWNTVDYCCADDQMLLIQVFGLVAKCLGNVPENIDCKDIKQIFPETEFKPIDRDAAWGRLHKQAGMPVPDGVKCDFCRRWNYHNRHTCLSCNSQLNNYGCPKTLA